jgi:transcriptional regulator with XRE-family HTH domain
VSAGGLNLRVARRIAEVRRSLDLTQRELADRLDIAVRNYQRIEHGAQNLTLEMIENVAEALGIDATELLVPPSREAMKRNPAGRPRAKRRER